MSTQAVVSRARRPVSEATTTAWVVNTRWATSVPSEIRLTTTRWDCSPTVRTVTATKRPSREATASVTYSGSSTRTSPR